MSTATISCGCGCNPCTCLPPGLPGSGTCLPAACLPRPTFFDGQVIGSADLNAIVDYARNQEAILARLLGGWGILGGLKVDVAPGLRRNLLGTGNIAVLSSNPQVVAGTRVQVSPGVAIDAVGNRLVVCAPVTLDIATMALQTPQARLVTATCAELLGPECLAAATQLTATEFFLIAEATERSVRPVGRVNGPGACDPQVGCDFSRALDDVKFSLVPALPDTYQFTGCAGGDGFTLPAVTLGTQGNPMLCRDEVFAYIDNVQGQLANICCSRPAVVLAKVLLTRAPGGIAAGLPSSSQYVVIADGYPCRKPTFQVGWFTKTWPNVICNQTLTTPQIAPGTVIQTAGDHVLEKIVVTQGSAEFGPPLPRAATGTATVRAQLTQPRLSTSSLKVTFSASFVATSSSAVRFRVLVDGFAISANGQEPLTAAANPDLSSAQISGTIPVSLLGEAKTHFVEVQVSMTPATGSTSTPTLTIDPAAHDGASIVIQEIAI